MDCVAEGGGTVCECLEMLNWRCEDEGDFGEGFN